MQYCAIRLFELVLFGSRGFGFLPKASLFIPVEHKGQFSNFVFLDTIQHGSISCDDLFLDFRREHKHIKDMFHA